MNTALKITSLVLAVLCAILFWQMDSAQSKYDACQGSIEGLEYGQVKADSIANANTKYLQQALDSCSAKETTKITLNQANKIKQTSTSKKK